MLMMKSTTWLSPRPEAGIMARFLLLERSTSVRVTTEGNSVE